MFNSNNINFCSGPSVKILIFLEQLISTEYYQTIMFLIELFSIYISFQLTEISLLLHFCLGYGKIQSESGTYPSFVFSSNHAKTNFITGPVAGTKSKCNNGN